MQLFKKSLALLISLFIILSTIAFVTAVSAATSYTKIIADYDTVAGYGGSSASGSSTIGVVDATTATTALGYAYSNGNTLRFTTIAGSVNAIKLPTTWKQGSPVNIDFTLVSVGTANITNDSFGLSINEGAATYNAASLGYSGDLALAAASPVTISFNISAAQLAALPNATSIVFGSGAAGVNSDAKFTISDISGIS